MKAENEGNNVRERPVPVSLPWWRSLLYALLPSVILFGGLELALRVVGFEFHGIPRHLQFGPNLGFDIERNVIVPDEELFWRLRVGPDNKNTLMQRMLVHPLLDRPEVPAAVSSPLHIVTMGDSCTFFGLPSYPMLIERELNSHGLKSEVFNASLPGYSSYQGRRWFDLEITGYRPDWITLYYGWNDHWFALRAPDQELSQTRPAQAALLGHIAEKCRVVQAALWLQLRISIQPPEKRPFRVPLENYRDNLNTLCRGARDKGIRVIMITAPSDLDENDLTRLRDLDYISDPLGLPELHERYNQVVRDVSEECGADLIDFSRSAKTTGGLISEDGIHLTQKGITWLASKLAETVAAETGVNTQAHSHEVSPSLFRGK